MRCFYAQHIFPLNILIPEYVEHKFQYRILRITQWKANGFNQHKNEIQLFLTLNHIDNFPISETHFTSRSHFAIPGFNLSYTNHPDGTAHGGSAILIKSTVAYYELLTLRRLMSYIYGAPILDVSRSHTTTQHSR